MQRILFFAYGLFAYAIFFCTFLYAIGFVSGFAVPKSIDSAPSAPLLTALLIDAGLLALFALQHSVMARKGFKQVWTKIVPEPIERSTYVLASSAALIFLFWKWEPIGVVVWNVGSGPVRALLVGVSSAGWLTVLASTFLIDHFDLFGLRQVLLHLEKKPYTPLEFTARGWYAYVRHPLYLGFLVAFWAAPTMTVAHLVFAGLTTGWVLIAIQLEERDLVRAIGPRYEAYRAQVPMLIPGAPRKAESEDPLHG